MSDWDSSVGGCGNSGCDAGNDLEGNRRVVQSLRLFASTPEHERVAALEPHHALAFASQLDEEGVDLLLRNRVLRAAALADVVQLGSSGFSRTRREERRVGERVVHDCVRRIDELSALYRDETSVTRTCANEKNSPFYHPALASGESPARSAHALYSMGEISDGLISLRPPQNTFV